MADINFFQPDQNAEIKRRRRFAELLAQNTPKQDPYQMAGGLVVPTSPIAALAGGISTGLQAYNSGKADMMEASVEAERSKAIADALGQLGTDPTAASAELMKIDPNLGIQLMNATKNTDEKTKEIKNFEYINSLPPEQRQAASAVITPKAGGVIGYDDAGNPIMSAKPVELSTRDQMKLYDVEKESSAANSYINQADNALQLLNKIETGQGTDILGKSAGWLRSSGMASKDIEQYATNYDSLVSLSNELGSQALQQFGGNDTDKELQVAIKSNLSPSSTTESNINNIKRKIVASKILAEKGDFYTKFANKNGSLNSLDRDTGESLSGSWMKYQRGRFKELTKDIQAQADQSTPANTTQSGWTVEVLD